MPPLDEALRRELTDPQSADELYARIERANRVSTWWLVVLAVSTVGAESLYLHSKSLDAEDLVAIAIFGGWFGMSVPVYACLWREHRILNRGVDPVGLIGQALGLSLTYLLLETLTIAGYAGATVVFVGLPLHLAFVAPFSVALDTPLFPSPTDMPWVYTPEVVVGGFVALWLIVGGHTSAVIGFLFNPLRYVGALAFGVRSTPAELIVFGAFTAGTVALVGTDVEAPYATFAAALPAALVIFRDGLTGRDMGVGQLIRLGRIRTSLWRASPGGRGRFWHRGRAVWLLDRLHTELDREDSLAREVDTGRRKLFGSLYDPLYAMAFSPEAATAWVDDSDVAEIAREEPEAAHGPEWTMSARNTQMLLRHMSTPRS